MDLLPSAIVSAGKISCSGDIYREESQEQLRSLHNSLALCQSLDTQEVKSDSSLGQAEIDLRS